MFKLKPTVYKCQTNKNFKYVCILDLNLRMQMVLSLTAFYNNVLPIHQHANSTIIKVHICKKKITLLPNQK